MLFACFCAVTRAQVAAGDVVSGTVSDDLGPLMMVNVIEVDNSGRIVAHGVTDINGNFSFRVQDPKKNKIKVSYIGLETQVLPINKKVFNIVMKSQNMLKEVVKTASKKSTNEGLAIPVTEMSVAQQTISMQEFEGLGMTSVDEALQGRISGLDIVMNSGNLGSGTTMRLRGVSTINGDVNPLIVVNGNIWVDERNEAQNFDFSNANEDRFAELLNVNPNDIESISVLKDAAATAVWGSQGSNGVIEIRTKRGQKGKTRVQYQYRLNGTWQPEGMKILSGDDYTMYLKEAYFNPQLDNSYADKNSPNYIWELNYDKDRPDYEMFNNNTKWEDEVKQFSLQHSHHISLTGGGEKARFRISGGYDTQGGSVIKQHYDRFTTRVALDYYVSDRITVSTNFDLTYSVNDRENGADLLGIAYQKMPNIAIYEEDANGKSTGEFYTMPTVAEGGSEVLKDQRGIANPVALAHLARTKDKSLTLSPEFILKYDILGVEEGRARLTYEGRIIFNIASSNSDSFYPTSLLADTWQSNSANKATSNASKSNAMTTTHSLTFQPHFNNEDHSLMMMARAQYRTSHSTSQSLTRYGLATGDITSSMAGGIISGFGTGAGEGKSNYYTGQIHYSYKGRYSVTGTLRVDGSTNFGPDRRWGAFPALSARWNISDEPWMENVKWLNMLSIRPGWGVTGRQPGSGLFYSKYGNGTAYIGESSIVPLNIRLADLRWERKETWNLGFDLGLFDNKLTADLSIYTGKTTDLLLGSFRIPSSSGYENLSEKNGGAMRNTGWEFNIQANDVLKFGKLSMSFNVAFANNKNEILEMEPTHLENYNPDFVAQNGSYLSRIQLHNPLGAIYGFRYKGVYAYTEYSEEEIKGISGPNAPVARNANGDVIFNENGRPKTMRFNYGGEGETYEFKGGDAIYEDINHDGNINELDIVYIGSSLPKLTGGFGTKFRYDRWMLNLQFNYRVGMKAINKARMNAESMYDNNNQSQAVNWRWHNEGDCHENILPRALRNYGFNWLGSDRFVEDVSFLRLNYMQLSYSFDSKDLKKLGLGGLSFNLVFNNVFCITKYSGADPEFAQPTWGPTQDSGRTPRNKSFQFGATVSF